MKVVVWGLLVFCLVKLHATASPVQDTKCRSDAYPLPQKDKVETIVINLDLEPEERWKEVAVKLKPQLVNLLQEIKNFTDFVLKGKLFDYINKYLPDIVPSLPDPYGREIKGIASATGLPLGEVVLYNIFYEVFTVCTSIIAETPQGKLYHARNLDFGLFLGWDVPNNTWALTEALRPLIRNFDFQRKGKTVYVITGFAGFVGAITGIKPGVITITMNERFGLDGGYIGLLEWIIGERDARWVTFLARDLLDSATSFDTAKDALTNTKILAPCYYILGGNSSGQGVVITRGRTKSLHPMSMNPSKGTWYVLQTNYDNWKDPLIIDDRRNPTTSLDVFDVPWIRPCSELFDICSTCMRPGKHCMAQMTQKNVGVKGLFNVLSSIPVLNKLTTYSTVMQVNSGEVVAYRRYCPDPCFPW